MEVLSGSEGAPAIVLLHGNGWSHAMWQPQITALSNDFRVIAPDLPGFGARAGTRFTMDGAVEVVSEVIARHAGRRALVAGLSMGGYVAMAHAAAHPEQVAGLVLSGCSVAFRGRIRLLSLLFGALYDRLYSARWERRLLAKQRRDVAALYPSSVIGAQLADGFYPREWGRALLEMARCDVRAWLRAYPGSVLILNGERDRHNRAKEDEQARAARHASLAIIRDAGHLANLDQPDVFTSALARFATQTLLTATVRPDGVA